jgi:hypothetical protein
MANRKHNFAIFDTETIGISPKLVYDLGVIICDRFGNEITRQSWVVREIITNPQLMQGAYYSKKTFTHYIPALAQGTLPLVPFFQVRQDFNALIEAHNVQTVCAYNIAFDRNALKETLLALGIEDKFLQHKVAIFDLWLGSCLTLVNTNKYRKFCHDNNMVSDAGNVKTSAEAVYSYITQNPGFVESHTAIEDCEIELAIFAKIAKQKKKLARNIIHAMPWQIVQRKK